MFYSEEEVQGAVDIAIKIFGSSNTYLSTPTSLKSVTIFTKEYGKLWFGDIEQYDLLNRINSLSSTINQQVLVVRDQSFGEPLLVSTAKLRDED